MPVIPVVHGSRATRAALRRGIPRRSARLKTCRGVGDVRRLLARELVDAVVVDVLPPGQAEQAFGLAREFPGIPVFALSAFRPDDGRLLVACRDAGLTDTLVDGVDSAVAGHVVTSGSASRRRRTQLGDAPRLLRLTEPIQRRAFDEVFLRVGSPTTTGDIARALRRTREHLSREFAAGGAPNLKRVIDLAGTVCAADLLANPGYRIATVARVLRYSSASHLAGVARRVAGVPPSALGSLGPRGVLLRFLKGRTRSRI